MEHEKIIKLLEFLSNDALIEVNKNGIIIKNFQYSTNIKIEGLPDWNYKVEFALKTERNPFKKLDENKGESFVLPYDIMKVFLDSLTEEINTQQNKEIIENYGKAFFNEKRNEILSILNSDTKIEEEFRNYILCYNTELFNNVMSIDKPDDESVILNHEFIQLSYTYLISQEPEDKNGADPSYTTETIKLAIPTIEIENYLVLSKCFVKPIKNDYASLIDILRKNNQDNKMNKLLLYTKLEVDLEPNQIKTKPKKI